jgi:hypothetical protein
MAGAFYDVVSDDTRNGIKIIVDWKDDPDKYRGLYHGELIPGTDTYKLVIDDMGETKVSGTVSRCNWRIRFLTPLFSPRLETLIAGVGALSLAADG